MRIRPLLFVAVAVALVSSGCLEQEEFTGDSGYYAFAMTEEIAPIAEGEDGAVYMIESRVDIPLRPPTADEMAALAAMPAPAPYGSYPWVVLDDLRLEVDVVITNLTAERRDVAFTIDGYNEFHEYVPGILISPDGNDVIPNYSMWERTVSLEPGEQFTTTIFERDVDEIALDLATVVNGAPNSNEIVFFNNQNGIDERAAPYVPAVIPGLTGFRMGIRTDAASKVVAEISLRVRDMNDKLSNDPTNPDEVWATPAPTIFMAVSDYEL